MKLKRLKVMQKQCDQCLFSKNKIVSDEAKAKTLKQCQQEDSYFVCHKASIKGEDVACRGYYDTGANTFCRLATHFNMVDFVNYDKEGK